MPLSNQEILLAVLDAYLRRGGGGASARSLEVRAPSLWTKYAWMCSFLHAAKRPNRVIATGTWACASLWKLTKGRMHGAYRGVGNTRVMRRRDAGLEKLTADEMRMIVRRSQEVVNTIAPVNLVALRNRALIGVIGCTWASVDAVIAMRVRDYYWLGDCRWVRLLEVGGERHELISQTVQRNIDQYIKEAGIGNDLFGPLFRSIIAKGNKIGATSLARHSAILLARRALDTMEPWLNDPHLPAVLESIVPNSFIDLRDRAIVGILHYAGLKRSALAKLRVGHIVRSPGRTSLRVAADSQIPVPPILASMIRAYLEALGPTEKRAPLFCGENGPISAREIGRMVRQRQLQTPSDLFALPR